MLPDQFDLPAFDSLLTTRRIGKLGAPWPNEVWQSIGSTNDRALQLAASGAPEGVVVLAREQTAGRGRQGKSWIAPAGSGIQMSVVTRPELSEQGLPVYTLAVGVACVRAILSCAETRIGLKWVNDMVYGGKKLGGILCEMSRTGDQIQEGQAAAVIVGIGINVHSVELGLPVELREAVEWLDRVVGRSINLNVLAASIAAEIESMTDAVAAEQMPELLDEWRSYCVMLDKYVTAQVANEIIEGLALDVDSDGGLLVQRRSGDIIKLQGGQISVRTTSGTCTC